MDEPDALLLNAMNHFRAQEMVPAAAALAALLHHAPSHGPALVLLGLVRTEQAAFAAAEDAFRRAHEVNPADDFPLHMLGELRKRQADDAGAAEFYARAAAARPDFAAHHNALGIALQRLGENGAALAALNEAIRVDPAYATALCNRGLLLESLRQAEDAAASFYQVMALTPATAADWHTRGLACQHLGLPTAAEGAARAALAIDAAFLPAQLLLAESLELLHRGQDAQAVRADLGRRQRLVTQPCFAATPQARILLVAGSGLCNIPTEYLLDRSRFEVSLVHLAPHDTMPPAELPPHDLVFNVIGDADAGVPFLAGASALCAALPAPLLNPPSRVPPTRRDRLADLLGDIPGLVVPQTRRLTAAAVRTGETLAAPHHAGPWLIRPAGSHGGVDLRRIDSVAEMADYLADIPADDYYLTAFHEFRSADGLYRKARFVFVGEAVLPYHLATCETWLAHYWRADLTPAQRIEEAAFLDAPETLFPPAAMAAIHRVARRLDLDFGGIDCAALPDGRVLLFEANATMLVHLTGSAQDFATQHRHAGRIQAALSALVLSRTQASRPRHPAQDVSSAPPPRAVACAPG